MEPHSRTVVSKALHPRETRPREIRNPDADGQIVVAVGTNVGRKCRDYTVCSQEDLSHCTMSGFVLCFRIVSGPGGSGPQEESIVIASFQTVAAD